ncbi:MAG: hypothetical protein SCALA701_02690 [Candidatus Scalindua sp.]|nr:MAG: hypothetical protein SCALA701_02690 [Candidatus Scalindua sp.]
MSYSTHYLQRYSLDSGFYSVSSKYSTINPLIIVKLTKTISDLAVGPGAIETMLLAVLTHLKNRILVKNN